METHLQHTNEWGGEVMGEVFLSVKDIPLDSQENYKWIDARFNLQNSAEGSTVYQKQHIAEAVFWDLEKDLSDMEQHAGRHPMPTKDKLQALFERNGLQMDDSILVYDQGGTPFAARAWWLLKYGGFQKVQIVQEGYNALVNEGFKTSNDLPVVQQTSLNLKWQEHLYADRIAVKEIVDGHVDRTLLDARSNARYKGDIEPIDKIAGHIPGAINYDWEQLLQDGKLCPNESLLELVSKKEPITVYCGSGVTAAPLFAMLKEMAYEDIQLYTGSYSDWIQHFEIEKA
ncbi:sulfurtransferase [Rummeliibacillus stabekisii]|nr:sulfurtransferase [Rummeliibacillus stabekisii]